MNNSKTSYSLTKINHKKIQNILTSQRSINNTQFRRKNHSQLSNHNYKLNDPIQKQQNQTVYQQYYGIPQQKRLDQNQLDEHQHFLRQSFSNTYLNSLKKKNIHKITQQKIQKALENPFNTQQNNEDFNIVFEQSDVDEEFLQKITQNKQFIKMQKQNNKNSRHNLISEPVSNNDLKQKKYTKKVSIIRPQNSNKQKAQKQKDKTLRKIKSKSLFPTIKNLSFKTINAVINQDPYKLNRLDKLGENYIMQKINLQQAKLLKLKNIQNQKRSIKQKDKEQIKDQIFSDKNVEILEQIEQYYKKSKKGKFINNVLSIEKNKMNCKKKESELRLGNRVSDLKQRIGQRKSGKNLKSRLSIINQDESRNASSHVNRVINSPRYSSHSVFDNIQQFLSNPHQNNLKSQLIYLKQSESQSNKVTDYKQKQQQKLKQKIRIIDQKIRLLNKEDHQKDQKNRLLTERIQQQDNMHNKNNNTTCQPYSQQKNENTPAILQISLSIMQGNANSEYGTLEWRRLEKDKLKKSDFQKELKYVLSLQHKNQMIIGRYIENRKLLHETNLLKKNKIS